MESLPYPGGQSRRNNLLVSWGELRQAAKAAWSEPRRQRERGLSETEHLKRSAANAKRLDEAIAEIAAGKVVAYDSRDPSAPRTGLRRRP